MNKEYITKPRIYTYAGLGSLIIWTVCFVLALRQGWGDFLNAILPICLVCVPMIIFSLLMLMMSLLWYIGFEDDTVYFRNTFGITKKYNNYDLTAMIKDPEKKGTFKVYVYKGDKKITTITIYDTNFECVARFKNRV